MNAIRKCKECPKCGSWKEFSPNPRRPDGLRAYCKECENAMNRARTVRYKSENRSANVVEILGLHVPMKVCFECGETKALTSFQRNCRMPDGRMGLCGPCNNARTMARTPEARQKSWRAWASRNSRNQGAYSAVQGAITKGVLIRTPCDRCGHPDTHAHHHVSYAREDWLKVTFLCRPCHSSWHSYFGSVR